MSDTIAGSAAQIERLAAKAFAEHTIKAVTEDDEGQTYVYQCRQPGQWAYAFTVVFRPGFVAVYGDTGDIVLNPQASDSRGWVRRQQAPYFDYMLGKRPQGCRPPKAWHPAEVDEWLSEQTREARAAGMDIRELRDARRAWRDSDRAPSDAIELVWELADGDFEVIEGFYGPDSTSLWGCHALMCWKRLFEAHVGQAAAQ